MFTITVDSEELVQAWVGVRAAVRAGVRRGVSDGVKEGAQEAREKHVFKNRTGDLERSIVGRLTATRTSVGASSGSNNRIPSDLDDIGRDVDGAQFGVIQATMPYASFVENGTRPHMIFPKRATVLSWIGYDGGRVFARFVRHPGTRPFPFMAFAYLKCERAMVREIYRGVANAQQILDR